MFYINFLLFVISFIMIWLGSGLIVFSASKFSKKLKLSPFAFSFIFLGILTSIPEFSVGLQAVADNDPEIFVGNLLGGIPVLFLLVIPVLAIFGNGINLKHQLDNKTLLVAMGVILAPSVFIFDKRITSPEGAIFIVLYLIMLYLVERKNGIFNKHNEELLNVKAYSYKDIFKILLGIGLVFLASNLIVDKTMYFANFYNISAFYIGLILISLGTNLPELSLAVRTIASGKKEIAMGDYIGSAAANTFIFGLLSILHNGEVLTISNFFVTFIFIFTAILLFYIFSRTKNFISRSNGFALMGVYVLFVILEFMS